MQRIFNIFYHIVWWYTVIRFFYQFIYLLIYSYLSICNTTSRHLGWMDRRSHWIALDCKWKILTILNEKYSIHPSPLRKANANANANTALDATCNYSIFYNFDSESDSDLMVYFECLVWNSLQFLLDATYSNVVVVVAVVVVNLLFICS